MEQKILNYKGQIVRVLYDEDENKIFWVVKDLAALLGFATPHHSAQGLKKHYLPLETPGGIHKVATVDTATMQRIMTRGRRKADDSLKKWIDFEAIPTIEGII